MEQWCDDCYLMEYAREWLSPGVKETIVIILVALLIKSALLPANSCSVLKGEISCEEVKTANVKSGNLRFAQV